MAKRKKTITAGGGALVKTILYTAPEPLDSEKVRAEKSKMTSAAQKAMNDKTAKGRFELFAAHNFTPKDLFLTLTYRDDCLPKDRKTALVSVRRFIRAMRTHRKKRSQILKYVYTTENKHGDARYHHHIMINATGEDIEIIRSLWACGDVVDVEYLGEREWDVWAQYMTKESGDRPVGAQMWTGSRNLEKPPTELSFVSNDTTLTVPPGCHVLEKEEKITEFGSYCYIKYKVIPCKPEKAPLGRHRVYGKENSASCSYSGL